MAKMKRILSKLPFLCECLCQNFPLNVTYWGFVVLKVIEFVYQGCRRTNHCISDVSIHSLLLPQQQNSVLIFAMFLVDIHCLAFGDAIWPVAGWYINGLMSPYHIANCVMSRLFCDSTFMGEIEVWEVQNQVLRSISSSPSTVCIIKWILH